MKRFLARIAIAGATSVAIVIAMLGFGAGPALASFSDCPPNYQCFWEDIYANGSRVFYEDRGSGCQNLPSWFNDKASSFRNRTGERNTAYRDVNCVYAMGNMYDDAGHNLIFFCLVNCNDQWSSFRWNT